MATAFEVFEHLVNPLKDIQSIFKYSDTIIFSTELIPLNPITKCEDWWYFATETGQHIAFYTEKALKILAKKFNCFTYSKGDLHILTKREFESNPLIVSSNSTLNKQPEISSLLQSDFELAKKTIKNNKILSSATDTNIQSKAINAIDEIKSLQDKLSLTMSKLEVSDEKTLELNANLIDTQGQLDNKKSELIDVQDKLLNTSSELMGVKLELEDIRSSNGWKFIKYFRALTTKLFPVGSLRRRLYIKCFKFIRAVFVGMDRIGKKIIMMVTN
jgi:hypothetical protein